MRHTRPTSVGSVGPAALWLNLRAAIRRSAANDLYTDDHSLRQLINFPRLRVRRRCYANARNESQLSYPTLDQPRKDGSPAPRLATHNCRIVGHFQAFCARSAGRTSITSLWAYASLAGTPIINQRTAFCPLKTAPSRRCLALACARSSSQRIRLR
jgi:hypothetical protein